ncbi:MAG: hypothetical protein LBF00_00040 [Mycoplasmataceae bacterium]|jgi:hypothetical protein|nr:hypothetical protein [Mycoplasmataceae bacterium]
MTKNILKKQNKSISHKQYPLDFTIVALVSFILFPFVLANVIMFLCKSSNSILIDTSFAFSFIIGVVGLMAASIVVKYHSLLRNCRHIKIIAICLIVFSSILSIIGVLSCLYIFGIAFPYAIVLLDILVIAYVFIAPLTFVGFLLVLLLGKQKTAQHKNKK